MLTISRAVEIAFALMLVVALTVLVVMPFFRGSKAQREYRKQGMRMLAVPRVKCVLMPACSLLMAGLMSIMIWIAISYGAWEEAADMILLCVGLLAFIVLVSFFLAYCLQKRHVLYDEEQLLLGRLFHPYGKLGWHEIARMEIKDQDFFYLYDRDGVRRVGASADMTGYHDFYETALRHCGMGNATAEENVSAYQREYSTNAGEGKLRYRMGEYYVLLIFCLLMTGMIFVMGMVFGKSIQDMWAWYLFNENMEAKQIVIGGWVISIIAFVYARVQEITYDRTQIEFRRFPCRRVRVDWKDVQKAKYCARERNRSITLCTQKRDYVIRERQFCKGFSEFVLELQKKGLL